MNKSRIEALRERFPVGTTVELKEDMYGEKNMPKGLKGKLIFIDDIATFHVQWENGSSLGLIYGEDSFSCKFEQEQTSEQNQDNENMTNNQGHQM